MAPISVGIDLGQSHLRVGGFVLTKYIVAQGTKDVKVNGLREPSAAEVVAAFNDADQVVRSFFGVPNFQAAVVVVPNSTSSGNREAIASAARSARFTVIQVINEHTAVAASYAEKVKPTSSRRLAIVSVTGGILDVSIISVGLDLKFDLVAQETHLEPIDFGEQKAQESKHSGPGGLIGLVGGVVGGAVKTLVIDPLDKVLDIVKKLLSSPKLSESPVDEVVFVGKASRSEKLKQAVKDRFPNARVWPPEEIEAEEVAAYGAGVIAYKHKPAEPTIESRPAKLPVDHSSELGLEKENLDVADVKQEEKDHSTELGSEKENLDVADVKQEEKDHSSELGSEKENLDVVEEKHEDEGDEGKKDHHSSKKFVPISSVIF